MTTRRRRGTRRTVTWSGADHRRAQALAALADRQTFQAAEPLLDE
jgi:hypothetical protein